GRVALISAIAMLSAGRRSLRSPTMSDGRNTFSPAGKLSAARPGSASPFARHGHGDVAVDLVKRGLRARFLDGGAETAINIVGGQMPPGPFRVIEVDEDLAHVRRSERPGRAPADEGAAGVPRIPRKHLREVTPHQAAVAEHRERTRRHDGPTFPNRAAAILRISFF